MKTEPFPKCVVDRLLYVGRYYSSFLPGAKRSITRERKRYELKWPGVNAHVFQMLDTNDGVNKALNKALDSHPTNTAGPALERGAGGF